MMYHFLLKLTLINISFCFPELKETFKLFDVKGEGLIPSKELATLMRSCGLSPTECELELHTKEVEKNSKPP